MAVETKKIKMDDITAEMKALAEKTVAETSSKSAAIRALVAAGFTQGQTSRVLTVLLYPKGDGQVRPQFVSNIVRKEKEKAAK